MPVIRQTLSVEIPRFLDDVPLFLPGTSSIFLPLWLLLKYFSSISVGFANSQGKGHLLEEVQQLMTHAKCGLLADANVVSTCLQRMSCNGIIDQLIPFLLRLMRVVSQLTMINDKTLIAVLAAIHLLSAVGFASFDQDRMMYTTLRAIFENIFVNREVHDKERRDHVLDLINLERLKQLKQFFWQQVFDRLNRNRCIRHKGHLLYSITV